MEDHAELHRQREAALEAANARLGMANRLRQEAACAETWRRLAEIHRVHAWAVEARQRALDDILTIPPAPFVVQRVA